MCGGDNLRAVAFLCTLTIFISSGAKVSIFIKKPVLQSFAKSSKGFIGAPSPLKHCYIIGIQVATHLLVKTFVQKNSSDTGSLQY
jgi:hypothetical protein